MTGSRNASNSRFDPPRRRHRAVRSTPSIPRVRQARISRPAFVRSPLDLTRSRFAACGWLAPSARCVGETARPRRRIRCARCFVRRRFIEFVRRADGPGAQRCRIRAEVPSSEDSINATSATTCPPRTSDATRSAKVRTPTKFERGLDARCRHANSLREFRFERNSIEPSFVGPRARARFDSQSLAFERASGPIQFELRRSVRFRILGSMCASKINPYLAQDFVTPFPCERP